MLIWDADRSREKAAADLMAWADKVCPGGKLIVPCYHEKQEGVRNAVDDFLAANTTWSTIEQVENMVILRRPAT